MMGFDISASSLIASLIFSIIGIFVFRYGKKEQNIPLVITGIGLMTYSYFTHGPIQDWGAGAILCGVAYYYR